MAARGAVGWGWIVAALLLVGLVSQCGEDAGPDRGAPAPRTQSRPIGWRFVQPASANCRSGPSTNNPVAENLARNSLVEIAEDQAGWSRLDRAYDCWIRSDLLGDGRAAEPAPARSLTSRSGGGERRSRGRPSRRAAPSAYYANCSAARAAGAAPVYSNEPGYSRRLDRDGDGVGCE